MEAFEKAVNEVCSPKEISEYNGVSEDVFGPAFFQLKPGHVRSLQLIAIDMISKGDRFASKLKPVRSITSSCKDESQIAQEILTRVRGQIAVEDQDKLRVSFKQSDCYVTCPYCYGLKKVVSRTSKTGKTRFDTCDVKKHILLCEKKTSSNPKHSQPKDEKAATNLSDFDESNNNMLEIV